MDQEARSREGKGLVQGQAEEGQFMPCGSGFGKTSGEIMGVNLRGPLQNLRLKPQMKSQNQNAGSQEASLLLRPLERGWVGGRERRELGRTQAPRLRRIYCCRV